MVWRRAWIFTLTLLSLDGVGCACNWPGQLSNSAWLESNQGEITFGSDLMSGWTLVMGTSQQITEWDCYFTADYATYTTLILMGRTTLSIFNTEFEAFLCMRLTRQTDFSYYYYLHAVEEPDVNNDRARMWIAAAVGEITDPEAQLCDSSTTTDNEYHVLLKKGAAASASINCPTDYAGTFWYSVTDGAGDTTCNTQTEVWDGCTNPQNMLFDYAQCSTVIANSAAGVVQCLVGLTSGSDGLTTVYDDATSTFTCLMHSVSGSSLSVSQVTGSCTATQTPTEIPKLADGSDAPGALLITLSLTEACGCGDPPSILGVAIDVSAGTNYGAVAVYSCTVTGYSINGTDTTTCLTTGAWTTAPACTLTDCGSLSPPFNGGVDTSAGTTYLSEANYTCNSGYDITGSQTATCQADGSWTPASTCTIKDCDVLLNPGNGAVDISNGTTFGSTATYTCNTGYDLTGPSQAECLSDGSWAPAPTCVIKDCGPLSNPDNGTVNTSTGTTYTAIATYSCDLGYNLAGDSTATCNADGSWSSAPICLVTDCDSLSPPFNGGVDISAGTTYLSEANYTCNSGYDITGSQTATCQADGSWTPAPTCTIKDCDVLLNPDNGAVDISNGTTFGSTATYTCNTGYDLTGPSQAECLSDGSWAPAPTCVIKDCGPISNPDNGAVNTSAGTTYADIATYSCDLGYNLAGDSTATCNAGGSWSSAPICLVTDCDSLSPPFNGGVDISAGTTYLSEANYTCNSGYDITGSQTATCQADGSWTPAPTCTIKDCDVLLNPDNGAVDISNGTTFGSTATYTCNTGYDLTGPSQAECLSDGSWAPAPTCVIKDCGPISNPDNGAVNTSAGTTYADIATYSCDLGYNLAGDSTATCNADGSWSSAPICLVTDCGSPSPPSNGGVDASAGTTYLSDVTYTCNNGYDITGFQTATCLSHGSWTPSPTCTIKDCGALSSPVNGSVDLSNGTTFGSIATYTCDAGYDLTGPSQTECLSEGSWTAAPTCVIKDCGPLTDPTHGLVDTADGTTFGSTATFTCDLGYHATGATSTTCEADGNWSAIPSCTIEDCGELTNPQDGTVDTSSGTVYGVTATYSCNLGFDMIGAATVACQANGTWTQAPTCSIKDCGPLSDPANGAVNTSAGTTYGSTATYSCDIGFDLIGVSIATCQADESWSPAPTCLIGDCGSLSNPTNGIADTSAGSSIGDVAVYSCNPGYGLSGPGTATCQIDKTWTESPVCNIKDCGSLTNPTNGLVDASAGTVYLSVATYTCDSGYDLIGSSTVTCQSDGTWASAPTCRLKDCGSMSSPANGVVDTSAGTSYGSTAVYSCHAGYDLTGSPSAACQADGTWTSPPTCTIKDCGGLSAPVNGTVNLSGGTTYGSVAFYACLLGYTLTGASSVVCQAAGTWETTTTVCIFTDCGPLTAPANGAVNVSSTVYGSISTYTCNTGYDVTGSASVACRSDGTWSPPPTCSLKDTSGDDSDSMLPLIGGILGGIAALAIVGCIIAACMYWKKKPPKPRTPSRQETPDLLIEAMPHRLAGDADLAPCKLGPREHSMDGINTRVNRSTYVFPGAKSNDFMFKMPSVKDPHSLLHLPFSTTKAKYVNTSANHPSPAPVEQTPSILHKKTIQAGPDTVDEPLTPIRLGERADSIQLSVSPASILSRTKSSLSLTENTQHETTTKTSSVKNDTGNGSVANNAKPDHLSSEVNAIQSKSQKSSPRPTNDNSINVNVVQKPMIVPLRNFFEAKAKNRSQANGIQPTNDKGRNTNTVQENQPKKKIRFSSEPTIMEYIQTPATKRVESNISQTSRKKLRGSSTVKMANISKAYSGPVLPKFKKTIKVKKSQDRMPKQTLHKDGKYNSQKSVESKDNGTKGRKGDTAQASIPPFNRQTTILEQSISSRMVPTSTVAPMDIDLL